MATCCSSSTSIPRMATTLRSSRSSRSSAACSPLRSVGRSVSTSEPTRGVRSVWVNACGHVLARSDARAADVDDADAAVGLVAEQLLHPLRHLADGVDRGADEEVLLGAEPAEGEAEEQRPPHLVLRLVRAAAVEGLADVVDRRAGLHLGRDDLVLLRLAAVRPEVAARDDPGRAVLGGEVAQRVEHDDLELRHVHGRARRRDRSGSAGGSRPCRRGGGAGRSRPAWISISCAVLSR